MSRETFGQSLGEVRHGRLLFDGDGDDVTWVAFVMM